MARWTTADDVIVRWVGEDTPDDDDTLEALIGDAETFMVAELPDLEQRIEDDDVEQDTVVMVVARMVIRLLRNPSGWRQFTESTGPFSTNATFAGDDPGQLSLTDADRRALGYVPGQRAFTINPVASEL